MSIRVALHHLTKYEYDRPVTLSPQVVRLRPAPHSRTPILAYSLKITPATHFLNWQQDPQGNFLARLVFPETTTEFSVSVDLVADMTVINPFDFFLEAYAEKFPFAYEEDLARQLRPFLELDNSDQLVPRLVAEWQLPQPQATINFLVALNQALQQRIRYLIRLEPGVQSPEQTLTLGSGSCRDSAWLLVQVLRRLGLAARFVSGYLIQLKPDEKPIEGPVGPTEDFTDLHAWTEVYLPGAGWVGLDPTSGLFAGEGHIPLAATPDPSSAAPVTGLVSPSRVEFQHQMQVTRIVETPRVTLPYSDAQWDAIMALGHQVDQDLAHGDVRLTMGGEPTFVSIDNHDAPEWNTTALGEEKARKAGTLLRRLRAIYAPQGLLHYGQGKWYPGESLPRWAYTCYWRTDGLPLWQNPALLADPALPGHATLADAERFAEALAEQLRISPSHVIAAYEDPLLYIHKERQLPINVDPQDNKLDDPEERERLRQVFSRGLGQPTGFVLPLQKVFTKDGPTWQSGLWMLRARHLFLVAGDSPVGLRLPLASLPFEPESQRRTIFTLDPTASPEELPLPGAPLTPPLPPVQLSLSSPGSDQAGRQVVHEQSLAGTGDGLVRTALAVEARKGHLYVFMPPTRSAADYVELLAAIERTAHLLQSPIVIEGYTPPHDSQLKQIKVTPDPGVIEVNIQPASTWEELVNITTTLYSEARQCRLSTEKFNLDGRHTGTGGGNHIVMGSTHPTSSPFLRRPDLLRSLVAYWLNHPSLSYLFSGTFIGPTSQAPRVDETRADAIYELEIAFTQIPASGPVPPWLVDRIFRNLLVDVTGNTHRAEFCIDKLYSPDSSTGRLGLLEMRAFEMPPHARMSLTQLLLLRALVAMFWRQPYTATPIRWGTRLHDQFLLPFFVGRDFDAVLADLRLSGYEIDPAWFAPHFEFRFPQHGKAEYGGVELELRQAIEPWYVLGEEPGGGGTTRYVDSSVERLQVRVRNFTPERYALACNGRAIPLAPAGDRGDFVAGVRYRAWQPPSCLHPNIGIHTPLTFDLIDRATGRSIGGCVYHVAHPGGRNYETLPVNAFEAEARRIARFQAIGHTPGPMSIPVEESNFDFPHTLDLRRPAPAHVSITAMGWNPTNPSSGAGN